VYCIGEKFYADEGVYERWNATWVDDPDLVTDYMTGAGPDYLSTLMFYNFDHMFQAPYSDNPEELGLPYNGGFFYMENDVTGARRYALAAGCEGLPHTAGQSGDMLPFPQCIRLDPEFEFGDLPPYDSEAEGGPDIYYSCFDPFWDFGRFNSPFVEVTDDCVDKIGDTFLYETGGSMVVTFPDLFLSNYVYENWSFYHYEPWAWHGPAPRVIAAVSSALGGGDYLDRLTFDLSARAMYENPCASWGYDVSVPRVIGETVGKVVSEIVHHTADMLCFTMGGKLAMHSKQIPLKRPTLTADDGVESFEFWITRDNIVNSVEASYGGGYIVTGCHTRASLGSISPLSVSPLDNLSRSPTGKWTTTLETSASLEKYGICSNAVTSFPYLLAPAYGLTHLTRWADEESEPLYMAKVVQDLRGAGYDTGWRIDEVSVDSNVPSAHRVMRCVKKKIDFNSLKVTSTLLEEPIHDGDFAGLAYAGRDGGGGKSNPGSAWSSGFSSGFGSNPGEM